MSMWVMSASAAASAEATRAETKRKGEINKLLDDAGKKRGADGVRFEIVHDVTPYGEEWRRFDLVAQWCPIAVRDRRHTR